MSDRDYVLGTHDDEIERLGLQHRVWRSRALEAWARARIGAGASVIDFGAGPGFASVDLAEIVGPSGTVHALERSRRFLDVLETRTKARGLSQVRAHELDFATDALPVANADAAWVRWVFAFLPDPKAALKKLVDALKPGGVIVIHEYLVYEAWRLAPRAPLFERFIAEVIANWRGSGGEPNIGRDLPAWLAEFGLTLEVTRPHSDILGRDDIMWHWPTSFFETHIDRLVELGRFPAELGHDMRAEFARAAAAPGTRMVTPIVVEIIARK
jgi:SAM-dependent methyltransferase